MRASSIQKVIRRLAELVPHLSCRQTAFGKLIILKH